MIFPNLKKDYIESQLTPELKAINLSDTSEADFEYICKFYEENSFTQKEKNICDFHYFKSYAKKSLRLYACSDKIIYPIEMLAILDERKLISHKYKFLFKNEEILQNVHKIYTLNNH